ncbi:Sorbitol dehydrogenase [Klebsiella pneumoniae]|nr:Sorbitol dehydrogenase [Klebsiella pneumoniae]BBE66082.1 Sorbitol dehydrogenase [Klebsiella pneumoniae]
MTRNNATISDNTTFINGNIVPYKAIFTYGNFTVFREGANKQVISSQADSLIKISRIWADFFPANTSNQPI